LTLQELYRISFIVLSLTATACKSGPLIDVCVSDPLNGGLQCVDTKKNPYFKPYTQTENYFCLNPDDTKTLIDHCRFNRESKP
jgi:hypothetical protein